LKGHIRQRVPLMLIILYLSCAVGCSTSEYIEVNCPKERTATRLPRDPASTYRHYGSMYEPGYRATEKALETLISRLPSTDTLKVIAADFRQYLNRERSAVQARLEHAVASLQANPCDDKARGDFQFLIQYVNFNGNYLHNIASACRDTSANLRNMLEDYRRERN
jgi:hypothetical protein